MKQKFKFKAISYGRIISFTKTFDCPNFKPIKSKIKIKGITLPDTSIESQLMNWMDDMDKSDLMADKDLSIILDYCIYKPKPVQPTLSEYIQSLNLSKELALDLLAVYKDKEVKRLLKGKSVEKQVELLFSHLHIGYSAARHAYKRIDRIITGKHKNIHLNNKNENKKKNIKR